MADPEVGPTRFEELVATSERVAATSGRRDKTQLLATLLGRLSVAEIEPAVGFLIGWPRQGRLGVGWATLTAQLSSAPAAPDIGTLTLLEIDQTFARIATAAGKGSAGDKGRLLGELLARATEPERRYLIGLVMGEVRQGALEGVLLEAVARATGVASAKIQRAVMLAGDLAVVARGLLGDGESSLAQYRLELFRPVLPMLADSADDIGSALERLGTAAFEYKLDGARIQVHKSGSDIRVYTRNLNDVTVAVPEVVEVMAQVAADRAILDGEAIALDERGRPRPFQVTMRRFGRRLDVDSLRVELPVTPVFFDLLLLDAEELVDLTQAERSARLATILPPEQVVTRIVTADATAAASFLEEALARGHEGVMAKGLESRYEAGRRGSAWLKIKRAKTLDLVVLAAEWGHGRRKGWLSNIHLGARDPESGGFIMLGKTFKGMTDDMLAWQTEALLRLEQSRDASAVMVRPELVVEVAFDGIQDSPTYPGGLALRFARVKGYRPDKTAADADTIDAVRALRQQ